MRPVQIGVVIGLSLALAVLGLQGPSVGGSDSLQHQSSALRSESPVASAPTNESPRMVAGHGDSNTEESNVALNGNLIAGEPTIICVGEAALATQLREAVTDWNTRLSGLGFTAFDLRELSSTAECENLTGVHVVVRTGDCTSGGACYNNIPPRAEALPRQTFRRKGKSFAEIEYETTTIRKSTFMHELGHVLGLSDYKSCDALRGQGAASFDPDPHNQHFALMYNASDRLCRPLEEDMITGRDIRDLYEAYHVSAITHVELAGSPTLSPSGLKVTLQWDNGANELYHNASHIAVFARDPVTSAWKHVDVATLGTDVAFGDKQMEVTLPGTPPILPGAPTLYPTKLKIVGLTRGDIRWLGREVNTPTDNAARWELDRELRINAVAYTEGDPTYVSGTFVKGTKAVSDPRVLSVSLSPRYCWTNSQLKVSTRLTGGAATWDEHTVRHQFKGSADSVESTSIECGASGAAREFATIGEWSSEGVSTATERIDGVVVYARTEPAEIAMSFTVASNTCTGSMIDVNWLVSPWAVGTRLLIDDTAITTVTIAGGNANGTSSVACDGGDAITDGFAIREDGSGVAVTTIDSIAAAGTGALTAHAVASSVPGAYDVELSWGAVNGARRYRAKYVDSKGVEHEVRPVTGQGDTRSTEFESLLGGSTYTFMARAERGRATTGWVPVSVTLPRDPLFQVTDIRARREEVSVTVGGVGARDAARATDISFSYDLRLEERVSDTEGTSYVRRLTSMTPKNVSLYTHTFVNSKENPKALQSGRTYRVKARLVVGEAFGEWVHAKELAATFDLSHSVTSKSAALSWGAASGATSYIVRLGEGAEVPVLRGTSYQFLNLSPEQDYVLNVRAVYGALVYSAWSSVNVTTSAATPAPPAPQPKASFGAFDSDGDYSVRLSWPAVAGASGYVASFDGKVEDGRPSVYDCPTPASGRKRVYCDLTADQTYEFEVRAVNSNDDASEAGTVKLCLGPCEIRVSNVSTSSVTLNWTGLHPNVWIHHLRVVEGVQQRGVGSSTTTSHRLSGLTLNPETKYRAEVQTWYAGASGYTNWVGVEFTTPAAPKPDPLTLTVKPSRATCLTGESVTLSWSVTGGSGKHTVSVNGTRQSGSSASVTCQSTAGAQTVSVVATDTVHATLTKTQTITLTVTKPKVEAPTELSVDADVTSLTLKWKGPAGATGYGVRIDRGAETTLLSTTTNNPFSGLTPSTKYKLEVRAYVGDDTSLWASIDGTTTAPPALALTASASTDSCETGGEVSVNWAVTGGSGKHTVTVDGVAQTGSSTKVTCQATAGTQSVTVKATDTTYPQLSATQMLTLTVIKPNVEAPTKLGVDAEVTKLTLKWEGPDAATGYGVRRDGGAETKLPATTLSHPFSGLTPSTKYKLEVRAYIDADYSVWSSIEATTLSPPPLVLTAKVEPTSCETNAQVTVSWTVTGGSDSHAVSVDGDKKSGASAKVTCQASAGTQSVTVKATDTTYPQLTATRTLSLTVTKPAPPTSATAQIRARHLSDNRVEFRLRLADGTEETTAKRYMKLPEVTAGRWYSSSPFTTSIEGVEYTLGVVSARLDNTVCPAFVAVTFIPTGGERITPTKYKLPVDREADLWAMTSEFAVPLKPTSTALRSAQVGGGLPDGCSARGSQRRSRPRGRTDAGRRARCARRSPRRQGPDHLHRSADGSRDQRPDQ